MPCSQLNSPRLQLVWRADVALLTLPRRTLRFLSNKQRGALHVPPGGVRLLVTRGVTAGTALTSWVRRQRGAARGSRIVHGA